MSNATRILVIEDEPAIADTLVYALRSEGFSPEWRATGREGLAALREAESAGAEAVDGGVGDGGAGSASGVGGVGAVGTGPTADRRGNAFALVILDVGLPDTNGFDVCREIRARRAVPVLFLTARSSEIDRVVGLELGGDDYVTKPFSPREVTARVRAILRRTQAAGGSGAREGTNGTGGANGGYESGGAASSETGAHARPVCHLLGDKLRVDLEAKRAVFCGVALELTRYEFRLLAVLHSRPGRVWSRDELMERVWEDPGSSLDRTVDAHIKTLRAKLRAVAAEAGEAIVTHRGEGYSLRVSS